MPAPRPHTSDGGPSNRRRRAPRSQLALAQLPLGAPLESAADRQALPPGL